MKFSLNSFSVKLKKLQVSAVLLTFTQEIYKGKLIFCAVLGKFVIISLAEYIPSLHFATIYFLDFVTSECLLIILGCPRP